MEHRVGAKEPRVAELRLVRCRVCHCGRRVDNLRMSISEKKALALFEISQAIREGRNGEGFLTMEDIAKAVFEGLAMGSSWGLDAEVVAGHLIKMSEEQAIHNQKGIERAKQLAS